MGKYKIHGNQTIKQFLFALQLQMISQEWRLLNPKPRMSIDFHAQLVSFPKISREFGCRAFFFSKSISVKISHDFQLSLIFMAFYPNCFCKTLYHHQSRVTTHHQTYRNPLRFSHTSADFSLRSTSKGTCGISQCFPGLL